MSSPFVGTPARPPDKVLQALQQAMARHQSGDLVEAARLYKLVLRKVPDQFDALHLLGLVEAQRGRPDRAERLIRQALKVNPSAPEAYSNLGNVQRELTQLESALASYEQALRLRPAYANAHNGRGIVLMALGRSQEALASFDSALAIEPRFAGALHNRGLALRALDRFEAALASFERAAEIETDSAAVETDRGSLLVKLGRLPEALAAYRRALAIDPRSADALYNQGVALVQLQRSEEALASFDQALAAAPDFAAALGNRGNVLVQLGRLDEALASFDRALALDPDFLSALADKGQAALSAGRHEIAADAFERLVDRDPEFPYALGNLLYCKAYCNDWRSFEPLTSQMEAAVRAGKQAVFPGHLLALSDSPDDQLRAARVWVEDAYAGAAARPPARRFEHGKIRLAYLSANLHDHAMPALLAGMFERHDRTRFETYAFSFGSDDGSEMRARLTHAFDHFVDVSSRTDQEVAAFMQNSEIDIAVDLMGFTQAARPHIFMTRPANVQVSYMGFAGTTGLPCLDYLIADRNVVPEEQKGCYSERVVYFPDTYYGTDNTQPIAAQTPTRTQAELPEDGFVFCCFNNNYKITPDVFAVWMRLLGAVAGSVLWLLRPNATAMRNLRSAAQAHGIAAERLVFAPRAPPADHLARHRLADLFLDTIPYNAHTTATDALWAGLPVLTRIGHTFASRVAASLLHAVGLPELVTDSLESYEALALHLTRNPAALAAIKAKLAKNRDVTPLFDTDRFRRHMEQAFITMWERHERGEPPASFAVEPLP